MHKAKYNYVRQNMRESQYLKCIDKSNIEVIQNILLNLIIPR